MATAIKTGFILTIIGKSKTPYIFELYAGMPTLGSVGGLYVFTKKEANSESHKYIYLGRSADMSERFDNHHKAKCIQQNGANHFGVCLMSDEKARVAAEADILAVINTTCNEAMN